MTTPTATDLLSMALISHGYHGLFNARANCACELDDLMPCGVEPGECRAGWRHPDADRSDEVLIWDQPPVDPASAGQQRLFNEEESE